MGARAEPSPQGSGLGSAPLRDKAPAEDAPREPGRGLEKERETNNKAKPRTKPGGVK